MGSVEMRYECHINYDDCDFCKEFGCDFEYNNCDGDRWVFSFNGMTIGY